MYKAVIEVEIDINVNNEIDANAFTSVFCDEVEEITENTASIGYKITSVKKVEIQEVIKWHGKKENKQ